MASRPQGDWLATGPRVVGVVAHTGRRPADRRRVRSAEIAGAPAVVHSGRGLSPCDGIEWSGMALPPLKIAALAIHRVAILDRQPGGPPLDPLVVRVALRTLLLLSLLMVPGGGSFGKCQKTMLTAGATGMYV